MTVIKARAHRGSFAASMATKALIPKTVSGLVAWIQQCLSTCEPVPNAQFLKKHLIIEAESVNDPRNGWQHTRLVSVTGYGPIGYINLEEDMLADPVETKKARSLLMALDYQGTITADIPFWINFIKMTESAGHRIVIVSMCTNEEKALIDDRVHEACPWIVPTCGRAKKEFLDTFGIVPDIWIDDQPEAVFINAV